MMQEEAGAAIIEGVKRRLERKNVGESEQTQEAVTTTLQAEPAESGTMTPRFGPENEVGIHPPGGQYTDITDLEDKNEEEVHGNDVDPLQEFKNAFTGSEREEQTDSEEE